MFNFENAEDVEFIFTLFGPRSWNGARRPSALMTRRDRLQVVPGWPLGCVRGRRRPGAGRLAMIVGFASVGSLAPCAAVAQEAPRYRDHMKAAGLRVGGLCRFSSVLILGGSMYQSGRRPMLGRRRRGTP